MAGQWLGDLDSNQDWWSQPPLYTDVRLSARQFARSPFKEAFLSVRSASNRRNRNSAWGMPLTPLDFKFHFFPWYKQSVPMAR
jgi:hypothetical protein